MFSEESVNGFERPLSHSALTNEAPRAIKVRLITPLTFHIQYSEYWEVWVSLETWQQPFCFSPPSSPESLLEDWGEGRKKKNRETWGGEKEKNDTEELFSFFLTSSAASLSFRSLANGIVLLSHDEWSCFPTPHPSRVMEIGFRTKIKMILFLWTLELVMCFTWELLRGQSWKKIGETKIKGAQTNLKQTFFFLICHEEAIQVFVYAENQALLKE